ncbi:MAG: structural protein [Pseudomonadota bacterium]
MPSRSARNHNPGNLRDAKWTRGRPGYQDRDAQGFAVFDTWWAGLKAMGDLLQLPAYQREDVRGLIYRYAPPAENDSAAYVTRVCLRSGCRPEDPVAKMSPVQFLALLEAMIAHEGWKA